MANKVKFYKLTAMPSSLTASNDGVYFIKPTTDSTFKMHIVNNGVGIELDAITLATFTQGLAGKYDKPTGTTAQYIRGDGTVATLNKAAVGLSNVDNTSDANKPISTATQTALNLKANDADVVHLAGTETISGTKTFSTAVTASTAPTVGEHLTNKTYVDAADTVLRNQINDLATTVQSGMKAPIDIDCSANPNYPVSSVGATYIVTVAGKIGGASGPTVEIGDMIICKIANKTAGTHASVGANFFIVQTNLSQATEAIFGYAKIATQAITDAGTDDTMMITAKKLAARLATFITASLDTRYVRFDAAQSLTAAQQLAARNNLDVPSKAEAVLVTGAQTISGVKTFSSTPRSSVDATVSTELVRLSQVQTLIQDAEITWTTEEWT